MCGPTLAWDWFVLDVAYVLVLVGGAIVLRARIARPVTWVLFGTLGIGVGALLFSFTLATQAAAAEAARGASAIALLAGC